MLTASRPLLFGAWGREFAGIVDAAGSASVDDGHALEGATIVFERQHAAALASSMIALWPVTIFLTAKHFDLNFKRPW
jgi:hypothetical protein